MHNHLLLFHMFISSKELEKRGGGGWKGANGRLKTC